MRAIASIGSAIGVLATANVLSHRVVPRASVVVAAAEVAGLAAIARSAGVTADEVGLHRDRLAAGARWGGAAAGMVAAGYAVALANPGTRAAISGSGASPGRAAVRAAAIIPLTTVLPEEYAFRGVLAALLARRFGARPARFVTAGLFGLWHVLPGLAGGGAANDAVQQVVGSGRRAAVLRVGGTVLVTVVGGLLMGAVRSRSGSLLAPVLLHWAINGLGELVAAG
jgi:membrane protease YdiL (CAAX protease family)